jgi:CO/xanthine dehydrogenase FAD-binding subunit
VELRSEGMTRMLPLEDFIRGPGLTTLAPGEILSAVTIPEPRGLTLQHFQKVGLRDAMACAVASLAALMAVSAQGIIERVRLAWGSVGPTVVRLPGVEAALTGQPLNEKTLAAAAALVRAGVAPISDVRAGAAYRRQVAGNLLLRLPEAVRRSPIKDRGARRPDHA